MGPRSIALLLLIFGCAGAGSAATLWTWSYSRSPYTASGTFTTGDTPDNNGGYLITAISGQRGGIAITGLQPTGTAIPGNEPYAVDNLIYAWPNAPFTVHGLGFSLADGSYANLYYDPLAATPVVTEVLSTPPSVTELPIRFEASMATPEPSALGLTLTGLALLAARNRRKP